MDFTIIAFFLQPFLDLFHFWNFSRNFYHTIHNQGRSDQNTIIRDRLDILDLEDLCFDPQFLDSLLRSILELIAFGSAHS